MNAGRQLRAEAGQLRLLWRDSITRLLTTIASSRDGDPSLVILWSLSLTVILPLLFSLRRLTVYQTTRGTPAAIDAQMTNERLFFIVYGMLVAALLAVVLWDALFPDRTDQEIIGVLPVRPRTAALARLAGAVTVCLGSTAAIAVPAGVFYSLAVTSVAGFAAWPRLFVGHVVAIVLASAFVFCAVMATRGFIAIVAGQRTADRLALLLQVVTIVSIVEGLLFLPGVLARADADTGNVLRSALPPLWFARTYVWIGGLAPVPWREALTGPAATAALFVVLLTLCVAPAAWMGRRVLLMRGATRPSRVAAVLRVAASTATRSPATRAIVVFAVSSIFRSRRHLLLLSTRVGIAVALGLVGILLLNASEGLVFHQPRGYWLSLPLLLIYFLVIGLRACFAIATDLEANWVLRLHEPRVAAVRSASRLVLVMVGVLPVGLLFWAIAAIAWPLMDVVRCVGLVTVSGIAFAELALWGWTQVPFATEHPPNPNAVKSGWPRYVAHVIGVGLVLPALMMALLRSSRATAIYIIVVLATTLAVRWRSERELRARPATFEPNDQETLTLKLSEAAH